MKSKKALVMVVIVAILFDWLILNKVPVVIPDNVTVSVDMESPRPAITSFSILTEYSTSITVKRSSIKRQESGKTLNLKYLRSSIPGELILGKKQRK